MERINSLEQRLQSRAVSIALYILTFLGVAVQVLLSLTTTVELAKGIGQSGPFDTTPIFDPLFMGTLVLFPVIYCSVISVRLIPKRMISPLNIQLGTFAVNTIIVVDVFLRIWGVQYLNSPVATQFLVLLLFGGFAAGFFQGMLGLFQTVFVRWFVGLNVGHLTTETYTIAANFRTVQHVLFSKAFRESVWEFQTLVRGKDTLVLRESQMILVVRQNGRNSLLTVVPLDEGLYALESSSGTANATQSMLNDLSRRLPRGPRLNRPRRMTPSILAVEGIALRYAQLRGKSQIAATKDIWGRLPNYLKYAIGITLLAYAMISGFYFLQHWLNVTIDFQIYFELSGYFLLVLVGELGLTAWQEIRHRKKLEELDEEE